MRAYRVHVKFANDDEIDDAGEGVYVVGTANAMNDALSACTKHVAQALAVPMDQLAIQSAEELGEIEFTA